MTSYYQTLSTDIKTEVKVSFIVISLHNYLLPNLT